MKVFKNMKKPKGPLNYYVRTEVGEGGLPEKANKEEQGEGGGFRSERLHFKRLQRRIIAAMA